MIDQQYIKRVSWQLCDHIFKWYIDIFRRSRNALWTHVKNTEKVKEKSFVCETIKKQIQNSKS